jgi:hypothetical protein
LTGQVGTTSRQLLDDVVGHRDEPNRVLLDPLRANLV